MKVMILAAGQGMRLRPLTDDRPKCMVEVSGRSMIERQIDTMHQCGIADEDITVICGHCSNVLIKRLEGTKIRSVINGSFEDTNMVYSLMCAQEVMQRAGDVLISYGDIIYSKEVLEKALGCTDDMAVVVDDGWYGYWAERFEDPLEDAETLMFDEQDHLTEIGQKTKDLARVQSQYIGLMRFQGAGLKTMLGLCEEARERSLHGKKLWKTDRTYEKMYMTDLLQGLIEEGNQIRALHIHRGWYEVDDYDDLKIAEEGLRSC